MLKEFVKELINLYKSKATATIYVKNNTVLKIIYILNGEFAYAQSNLKEDSLIGVLRREEVLTDHQIEIALKKQAIEDPIGKTLIELGYLTPLQLAEYTKKQQKEIFFSIFMFDEFEVKVFGNDFPPSITPVNLSLLELLREAIENVIERKKLLEISPSISIELYFNKQTVGDISFLTEDEMYVLELFKNPEPITKVLNGSKFDDFKTLKIITFLYYLGVLEENILQGNDNVFEEDIIDVENNDLQTGPFSQKRIEEEKLDEKSKILKDEILEDEEILKEEKKTKIFLIVSFIVVIFVAISIAYIIYWRGSEENIFKPELVKEETVKIKKEKPEKDNNITKTLAYTLEKEKVKKGNDLVDKEINEPSNGSKDRDNEKFILLDLTPVIKEGKISFAAQKYEQYLKQYRVNFTILLEVDCLLESVKNAYKQADFSPKMMIVRKNIKKRKCYAVLWGVFKDRKSAEKEMEKIPLYFKRQGGIRIIKVKDYFKF